MNIQPKMLELDPDIQGRVALDMITILEYAEAMGGGAEFPPVKVIQDGEHLWVWDGFHRVQAAIKAGIEIETEIEEGTFQDAQWLASGANIGHGLRRSNKDKRRAVEMALRANVEKSNVEIARHCGVAESTVRNIRAELESSSQIAKIDTRTVTRNGTTYIQDISGINPSIIITENEPITFSGPDSYHIPAKPKVKSKPTFNRTNDNIEWAAWSWNPVTGCKHGCPYCYARDIANRFYPQKFEPTYHLDRLKAPMNTKPIGPRWDRDRGHNGVFVCSMADLFGSWVPQEWIDSILTVVEDTPQWTYIFLTKNPRRLVGIDWPSNAWVGTTVDEQLRVEEAEESFRNIKAQVRFLSCEPMRERLVFSSLEMFDWVIIGGQSKSNNTPAFQPEWGWVCSLTAQAYDAGLGDNTYYKTNLDIVRLRGYPG